MTTLKAFDTLLRIKKRRIEQLEETAQQQMQFVQQAQQHHQECVQQEQTCKAAEVSCQDKISGLSQQQSFKPEQLITLGHVLESLEQKTKHASQVVAQAAQQVQTAQQELQQTRRQQQRMEQQIDQLREKRKELALKIEQAQEDLQDEESEETAVARMLSQRDQELLESLQSLD